MPLELIELTISIYIRCWDASITVERNEHFIALKYRQGYIHIFLCLHVYVCMIQMSLCMFLEGYLFASLNC